jgi:hypothetical protein
VKFYRLGPSIGPWGDYGRILVSGMTSHLPRQDGMLQLERTGPFIPPISFPGIGHIVVDDQTRRAVEGSGLSGCRFVPIIKRHIVRLDWQAWPTDTPLPPEMPDEGEPENYILERPHDPGCAEALGEVWEIQLDPHADTLRELGAPLIVASTWDETDVFYPRGTRIPTGSEGAVRWLQERYSDWVEASEMAVARG